MKKKNKNKLKLPAFIVNFCHEITDENPMHVPLRPLNGKPFNECFNIVPEQVKTNQGKQIIGWSIHVWRKVLIEAEFHCVWESPEGQRVDITPKNYSSENIIFLPDSKMSYDGKQVDNIRKPITPDIQVKEYIDLAKEFFSYINRGELETFHGLVDIGDDFSDKHTRMQEIEFNLIRKYGNQRGIFVGDKFIKYNLKSPSHLSVDMAKRTIG